MLDMSIHKTHIHSSPHCFYCAQISVNQIRGIYCILPEQNPSSAWLCQVGLNFGFTCSQDRQLEEAAVLVEGAGDLQAAQETASREEKLLASLTEAHSSLENLKRLHEGSQKQLFNMQSRSEEEQVARYWLLASIWLSHPRHCMLIRSAELYWAKMSYSMCNVERH